jgi:hypothetical protein
MEDRVLENGDIWYDGMRYSAEEFNGIWKESYQKRSVVMDELIKLTVETKRLSTETQEICGQVCKKIEKKMGEI